MREEYLTLYYILKNIFIKSKEEWTIRSEIVQKIYRQVYDKRNLNDNFETLPFGY